MLLKRVNFLVSLVFYVLLSMFVYLRVMCDYAMLRLGVIS